VVGNWETGSALPQAVLGANPNRLVCLGRGPLVSWQGISWACTNNWRIEERLCLLVQRLTLAKGLDGKGLDA
jgi:hypothetical protein